MKGLYSRGHISTVSFAPKGLMTAVRSGVREYVVTWRMERETEAKYAREGSVLRSERREGDEERTS